MSGAAPATQAPEAPLVVVVMGVSGTGKSTVAMLLSETLEIDFVEGDSYHPDANIEKMSAGEALSDEDRRPWLRRLSGVAGDSLSAGRSLVLTCSALKRSYRDVLRSGVPEGRTYFVHLDADVEVLSERMAQRTKHFMPTSLLVSQIDTLEPLGADERGVVVDVSPPVSDVAAAALEAVTAALGSDPGS